MPTLSAMFRLMDGYSSTVKKIVEGTDQAAKTILGASKNTDSYNDSLKRTGASANVASAGLTRLIGTAVSLAAVKKGMDLTDIYTNTSARLSMITNSLEEQRSLQSDIFASANRARGSYVDMANAAAQLKMLAGDSFGSNQEALGFTELLTKSLKVSGADQSSQNSAFLQLTQAMTSGKLQGDEFRSVMENAPMVADAIANYMGKSKTELRELSSKGLITSDIIKSAMFSAADDINGKFAQMPMTFADVWTKVENAGMQAFGGVFEKVSGILNSDAGLAAIDNIVGAIYLAGEATEQFIDFCMAVWPIVSPFIWAAATALGAYAAVQLVSNGLALISGARTAAQAVSVGLLAAARWAMTGATWAAVTAEMGLTEAQLGANAAMYACPVVWIVGGVLLLIAAFYAGVGAVNHFAGTSVSATGLIGAAFFTLGAYLYNTFIYPGMAGFALLANFIGNAFTNPTAAVKVLFLDMASACIGYALNMAKAIEAIINKIPGVTVDITSGLEGFKNNIDQKSQTIKDESGWKEFVKSPELLDYSTAARKGYHAGSNLADKASSLFSGFNPNLGSDSGMDFSQFGNAGSSATAGNPATVKGTGKGGAVKVENEEDIEWMRKLAERDYVARIAQNTLSPNIKVEFTGPITKEADVDGVAAHMAERLKEIIATAPEGVYP